MLTTTNAIPVTIVSSDMALLQDLAWFLATFGYEVSTSADLTEEATWRRADRPGILVIDGRSPGNTESVLAAPRERSFVYRICLYSTGAKNQASMMLDRGAEDVLQAPVSRAELLARLRAGARRLEFERRLLGHSLWDALTGLRTKAGLIRWLDPMDAKRRIVSESDVLVVSGIDWGEVIRDQSGRRTFQHLVVALAAEHERQLGPEDVAAALGDGVIGAVLRSRTPSEARSFAEAVATHFSARDTRIHETRSRPTISSTIHPWGEGVSAEEFVEQSLSTFGHVKKYGEGSVVEASEIDQEVHAWRNEILSGNPFADVVAQDVMESFSIVLHAEQERPAWTTAGGGSSPCLPLPCIPIIDDDGRLTGLLEGTLQPSDACCGPPRSGPARTLVANAIAHDLPLGEILQRFTLSEEDHLVVVRDERPIGYITREGLAGLIDPVTSETYRQEVPPEAPSCDLVVPFLPVEMMTA